MACFVLLFGLFMAYVKTTWWLVRGLWMAGCGSLFMACLEAVLWTVLWT